MTLESHTHNWEIEHVIIYRPNEGDVKAKKLFYVCRGCGSRYTANEIINPA